MLKPVIKMNDSRWKTASWVVDRFPEGYRDMNYLEPFLGCGSVFVLKERSKEEVLNDPDCGLMNVWRALRDEGDSFISKIRKTKYSETTFRRHGSAKSGDYLSEAVSEFVLRHMSKNGLKKSFIPRGKSDECRVCWKELIECVTGVRERLESSFLLCRDATEILRTFDGEDTFAYCNSPEIDEHFPMEKHMEVGSILKQYRGKVLVVGPTSALFKRMYSEWNRKSLPGDSKDSAWTNF